MAGKKSNWKVWASIGFLLLLAFNVVLCAAAIGMAMHDRTMRLIPEDSPPALRFVLVLAGIGLAWFFGRLMLENMIQGEVQVVHAVSGAWSVVFYVALFCVLIAFPFHWWILLILLMLALFLTVPAFWRLLGGKETALILIACVVIGAVVFYLMAS